jgi:hypothetical protein
MPAKPKKTKTPGSSWTFLEGVLTIHHRGETVVLGRYANHEWASKAAAKYFEAHGGQQR